MDNFYDVGRSRMIEEEPIIRDMNDLNSKDGDEDVMDQVDGCPTNSIHPNQSNIRAKYPFNKIIKMWLSN